MVPMGRHSDTIIGLIMPQHNLQLPLSGCMYFGKSFKSNLVCPAPRLYIKPCGGHSEKLNSFLLSVAHLFGSKGRFFAWFLKRISYVLWLGIWRSAYSPLAFWSVYPLNNVEEQFIIFTKSWKSITIHPKPSGAELENNFVVKTLV